MAAIHLYTQDFPLHAILNARLRNRERNALKPFFPFLKLLLTAFYKLPNAAAGSMIVYRGISGNHSMHFQMGKRKMWWAFSTCTTRLKVLDTLLDVRDGERTFFIIHAAHAYDVTRYSAFQQREHEVVLPPGTMLVVESVLQMSEGEPKLHMVQLKQQPYTFLFPPPPPTVIVSTPAPTPLPPSPFTRMKAEVENIIKYPNGKGLAQKPLDGFPGLTYEAAARQLTGQNEMSLRAVGLFALGRCCESKDGQMVLGDGRLLNERELYIEALRCDSNYAAAYYSLGATLPAGESVTLSDGRVLYQRELYIEALRYDYNFSMAYLQLSMALSADESVALSDGRVLNKRELYIEALRCNPDYSAAYNNLGTTLSAGESVTLSDGRVLNQRELYIEALRCDPNNSYAYTNLGNILSVGESVTLKDGRKLGKKECLAEAARCRR